MLRNWKEYLAVAFLVMTLAAANSHTVWGQSPTLIEGRSPSGLIQPYTVLSGALPVTFSGPQQVSAVVSLTGNLSTVQPGVAMTQTGFTVGSNVQIAAANAARRYLQIEVTGANGLFLNMTGASSVNTSIMEQIPVSGVRAPYLPPTGAIFASAVTSTTTIVVTEGQ